MSWGIPNLRVRGNSQNPPHKFLFGYKPTRHIFSYLPLKLGKITSHQASRCPLCECPGTAARGPRQQGHTSGAKSVMAERTLGLGLSWAT